MRIIVSIVAVAAASPARADRRTLIRAYEYMTQPQGNLELEIWNDISAPTDGTLGDSVITQRVELEYGITDHWDVALYHVFEGGGPATNGVRPPFQFASWRLETRFRPAERGDWPVDVIFYLEAERPAALDDPFEVEEKLILEKSLGLRFALVGNIVCEQALFHGGQHHLLEVDLGARYEVVPALRLGVEGWFIRDSTAGLVATQASAGPSLSVAGERFWLQIGAGVGIGAIGDNPEHLFIRSVLGINL